MPSQQACSNRLSSPSAKYERSQAAIHDVLTTGNGRRVCADVLDVTDEPQVRSRRRALEGKMLHGWINKESSERARNDGDKNVTMCRRTAVCEVGGAVTPLEAGECIVGLRWGAIFGYLEEVCRTHVLIAFEP